MIQKSNSETIMFKWLLSFKPIINKTKFSKLYIPFLLFFPLISLSQRVNKIPPAKPKLIIGIVVEQMRYDLMYKYWNKFGDDGFRKLESNGTSCKNAQFDYIYTQSAPGYATIVTGSNPCNHGIIADKWYNRVKNTEVKCVSDDNYKTLGQNSKEFQSSPNNMVASTIGDELKLVSNNKSKVISVALEPAAAVLTAGHIADGAYWLDELSGEWVTSEFYRKELPLWLTTFNEKKVPELYIKRTWETSFPITEYTECLEDNSKYEIGFKNSVKFPYNIEKLADSHRRYKILKSVPGGNTLTKDLAIQAILGEELGKDDYTDILYVNFTATEQVGLLYGAQSIELEDMYIKLDAELGFLIKFIENELGKENVLIYLTSNHGAAQPPRYMKDCNMPAGQFKHTKSIELLKSYYRAIYGEGEWLVYYNKGQIYLDHILIEDSKLSLNDVRENTARFMVQFTGVANAISSSTLENIGFAEGVYSQLLQSYNQKRSGDVFLNLEAGWTEQTLSECTDHNSGYSYDIHVPLIWYGWKTEKRVIKEKVSMTTIAPTLSSILDIAAPSMSSVNDGMVLFSK